jgi:hypothetical protein
MAAGFVSLTNYPSHFDVFIQYPPMNRDDKKLLCAIIAAVAEVL